MKGATPDVTNGVEATYKNAVVAALNSAELKAYDVREDCGGAPIDHAAQAALENSELTGQRFQTAYDEVWNTIYHLSGASDTTDEMGEKLDQVRTEILRVTYGN